MSQSWNSSCFIDFVENDSLLFKWAILITFPLDQCDGSIVVTAKPKCGGKIKSVPEMSRRFGFPRRNRLLERPKLLEPIEADGAQFIEDGVGDLRWVTGRKDPQFSVLSRMQQR